MLLLSSLPPVRVLLVLRSCKFAVLHVLMVEVVQSSLAVSIAAVMDLSSPLAVSGVLFLVVEMPWMGVSGKFVLVVVMLWSEEFTELLVITVEVVQSSLALFKSALRIVIFLLTVSGELVVVEVERPWLGISRKLVLI